MYPSTGIARGICFSVRVFSSGIHYHYRICSFRDDSVVLLNLLFFSYRLQDRLPGTCVGKKLPEGFIRRPFALDDRKNYLAVIDSHEECGSGQPAIGHTVTASPGGGRINFWFASVN